MSGKYVPPITTVNAPFWEGTARGELRVKHCNACGTRFRFTTEWCPRCWSEDVETKVTNGLGTIVACTAVHLAPYPAYADDVPYVVALVKLDDGPIMMSNIVGCDPAVPRVDMRVSVTFEERGGVALPQFRLSG